jgi:UbiD family decarboxylase
MILKDMRSFLRLLEEKGDLIHITEPVSPRFGVAAGIRKTSDAQGPALWFDNVIGSSMPVVGGLYSTRQRAIWGLQTAEADLFGKLIHGFKNPIPPRIVKEGPCKEVILTGQDADLGRLPICTHNRKDAGPFITIGIGFVSHPDFGNNVSISRMQVLDTRTTGIRAMQQIGVYLADAEKHGRALEVAVTIGNDPYVTLCSQVRGSLWLDELGVAGGWMGEPVDLVRCETIGVAVPATSEIVLEGEIICGERRTEGPFGEFPGYYQGVGKQPVFRLKAITHRRDPIYLTALTGVPTTDNHVLTLLPKEAMLYNRIREICPTVRDVCITKAGVGMHVVVSIRAKSPTQARDVMLAVLTTVRAKLVIVVDDDIDVRNPEQVEWAIATRFQADRDLVVIPNKEGMFLDPSTPAEGVTAVMAMDATRPYGKDFAEVCDVPGTDTFVIPGWEEWEKQRKQLGAL